MISPAELLVEIQRIHAAVQGYLPQDIVYQISYGLFRFFLGIMIIVSTIYILLTIYNACTRQRGKELPIEDSKAPFVTIQIPTYNERVAIRCAKKCLEFDYPKEKYEIIIGDDSSDAQVSDEIDAFAQAHGIKVTRRGSNAGFKSGNLNHMLQHSKGDIIVVFDSDFVPEKDFLRRIVAPFVHNPAVDAVQARWRFLNATRNTISLLGATIVAVFHQVVLPFMKRNGIAMLCGAAEAVRKDVLLQLGGWKHGSLTEDIEYSLRLLRRRRKILYLDTLECAGEVPHTAKDLYRQQMRWAYGVCHAFREHGKSIFLDRHISLREKFSIFVQASGYFFSVLLLLTFVFGTISFIFHAPGPIDIPKFFSELGINVLLSIGLLVAGVYSLHQMEYKGQIARMVAASLSYGIIVTYYVNKGICRVFLNKPMQWYMLHKEGNAAA
ncbi:glycosyltransferase [Candidatus Woesearchaeota archaeon]|nr:glycosyltransferase [Candidatus Woesearchaeota archaeon]